jgi:predicted MFS family arabinose efflux permease
VVFAFLPKFFLPHMSSAVKTAHPELTKSLLWVMAIATGLIVANLYYNQPLLVLMAKKFNVDNGKITLVSTFTQMGYATGMLLIAPLADMKERKRLILVCLAIAVLALLGAALAPSANILILASYLIGIFSLIPQLLVPMTAHLAKPEERGRRIGFVMSGLLIGILLSRTISGEVGRYFGWEAMFYIAAGLMVVIWLMLFFMLPKVRPEYKGTYGSLMRSMITLIREEPVLRIAAVRGALCFACFMAFWSTLTVLLHDNLDKGSDVAGMFGLIGAAGAAAAGIMGRLSDKGNAYKLSAITLALVIISFIIFYFSAYSLVGLVVGVIILDAGVQATHISNQSLIFALKPEARNRINTVYMVTYFIGGSLGTYITSLAWSHYKWSGVCWVGIGLSSLALILHFLNQKTIQRSRQGV